MHVKVTLFTICELIFVYIYILTNKLLISKAVCDEITLYYDICCIMGDECEDI